MPVPPSRFVQAVRFAAVRTLLGAALFGAAAPALAQETPVAPPTGPACALLDPAVDPLAALVSLGAFVPLARAAEPPLAPTEPPPVDPAPASPAAASPAAATPAVPRTDARAVQLAAHVVLACIAAGNVAAVADRVALPLVQAWYAAGQPITREQAIAFAALAPAVGHRLVATGDPALATAPGEIVLPVLYLRGNRLLHAAWTFAPDPAAGWRLVAETPLPALAAPSSSIVDATLADGAIVLSTAGAGGPNMVLQVRNDGAVAHEALLLEIPWGDTPPWLFGGGGAWPAGVRVAAQVTLAPGATAGLALVGLAPAQYAIVCLLPGPDGASHLADGEWAMLQIW